MKHNVLAFVAALSIAQVNAQSPIASAQLPEFFGQLSRSVVEVQLHKTDDNRTYSKGTGFLAGAKQWVVTNFHVIDTWVFETEEGIELRINGSNGFKTQAKVVLVDIWNDLALLKLAQPLEAALFEINPALPARGERGYTQIFLNTKLQDQNRGRFTLPTKACKTYDHHDYGDDFTGKDSRCRIGFGLPITDAPEAGYGMLKIIWVQTPEMSFFKRRAYLQSEYQALFKNKDTDLSEFMDDWDCSTTEARPIKGTNMRVEFCEREVDTLDGLAHYAARGLSLNGGSEHALFSFYLEGYSQENAKKVLEAVLEKMIFTQ